jgi:hypothetical protein
MEGRKNQLARLSPHTLTPQTQPFPAPRSQIGRQTGRLKKGGDPDTFVTAVQVINDFQRGRLPYYIPPPELKTDADGADTAASADSEKAETATIKGLKLKKQDLDLIGLDKGVGIGGLDGEGDEEQRDEISGS